ncbi:hypothetical protein Leef1_28 [Polaribacter phage Leef_1]|uniref:Uncharacterized protein n=1 Tax=Polaribacter phage Leef_1 TaxID=2745684 RepID=A0A8E5EC22_9CAUD|nr:hypothetical protein M1M28_gp28 [Polaribacter phage Leef_1]QQV91392.1 hypothetical protein Leef1_28 [Polaribacter phage Leef_1]
MKTLLLTTFLRPAKLVDIFSDKGMGSIIEDKQLYYKNDAGGFIGPYRLNAPFNEDDLLYYRELYQLLNDEKVFLIDPLEYQESLVVDLPLKRVGQFDILQGNCLIINTTYYLKSGQSIDGPFYINQNTTKENLKQKASNKLMFVLDDLKEIKMLLNSDLIAS